MGESYVHLCTKNRSASVYITLLFDSRNSLQNWLWPHGQKLGSSAPWQLWQPGEYSGSWSSLRCPTGSMQLLQYHLGLHSLPPMLLELFHSYSAPWSPQNHPQLTEKVFNHLSPWFSLLCFDTAHLCLSLLINYIAFFLFDVIFQTWVRTKRPIFHWSSLPIFKGIVVMIHELHLFQQRWCQRQPYHLTCSARRRVCKLTSVKSPAQ